MTKLIDGGPRHSGGGFAGMAVGETRTVILATRMVNGKPDPASARPKTITRTKRDFIFDWVDSTNAELAERGVTDRRWIVDHAGEPQLRNVRPAETFEQWRARKGW